MCDDGAGGMCDDGGGDYVMEQEICVMMVVGIM